MDTAWRDRARELAAQHPDWTNRQIAEQVGVTPSAVWKALNPDRAQEWAQRHNAKRSERRRESAERRRTELLERKRQRSPVPGQFNVTNGDNPLIALVDLDVWEAYRHVAWHISAAGYVAGYVDGTGRYLHRVVLGYHEPGRVLVTDHQNRDKLDNRRSNLRLVTQKENCANRGGIFAKDSIAA